MSDLHPFLALCLITGGLALGAWLIDAARRWWIAHRPDPGDGITKAKWLCLLCEKRRVKPTMRVCWLCKLKRAARELAR